MDPPYLILIHDAQLAKLAAETPSEVLVSSTLELTMLQPLSPCMVAEEFAGNYCRYIHKASICFSTVSYNSSELLIWAL